MQIFAPTHCPARRRVRVERPRQKEATNVHTHCYRYCKFMRHATPSGKRLCDTDARRQDQRATLLLYNNGRCREVGGGIQLKETMHGADGPGDAEAPAKRDEDAGDTYCTAADLLSPSLLSTSRRHRFGDTPVVARACDSAAILALWDLSPAGMSANHARIGIPTPSPSCSVEARSRLRSWCIASTHQFFTDHQEVLSP